jgi:protease-4
MKRFLATVLRRFIAAIAVIIQALVSRIKAFVSGPPESPKPDTERVLIELYDYLHRDRRSARWRRGFFIVLMMLIMLAPMIAYVVSNLPEDLWSSDRKLAYVRVEGVVGVRGGAEADQVIKSLNRAFDSDAVAVVLKIDSPGGSPYTADRIVAVIDQLSEAHPEKPLYAVIERTGASAAYMIAMHTSEIYVSPYSAVGSIGAIMTSWDFHELSKRYDINKHVFASGALKGMLDPFKPLSDDETLKAQAIVDAVGRTFADQVIEQRGERLKITREQLTTGEIWVGREALELGLADKVGTIETLATALDAVPLDMTSKKNPLQLGTSAMASWIGSAILETLMEPVIR